MQLQKLVEPDIDLIQAFISTRKQTESICSPLAIEDFGVQPITEVSPPKWHLAHTSWFFEKFILEPFYPRYSVFHPKYGYLFNSYYESAGSYWPRDKRGTLSRPTVEEVYDYREWVSSHIIELIDRYPSAEILDRITLGIHHEQQHQELLLTDIKFILWSNPLRPIYFSDSTLSSLSQSTPRSIPSEWIEVPKGLYKIGHADPNSFAYDNEQPQHKVYLEGFRIQSLPVTNSEYIEFIEAGGYENPKYWLSDGWTKKTQQGWTAPLYWEKSGDDWWVMTLSGMRFLDSNEPVCHISYYEADAFAKWRNARLPTEAEWEVTCVNFSTKMQQKHMVWEWTSSAYAPYPRFKPFLGDFAEYNGKFMSNQHVLRGGSRATPAGHCRPTYRNFFALDTRWQLSGVRLAFDASL